MPRTQETGFPYRYRDTDMHSDIKIIRLKKEFGANGIVVYDFLIDLIFKDKGFFIQYDKDLPLIIAHTLGIKEISEDIVNHVVGYCVLLDLFDKTIFDNRGLLTSRGIQKRWQIAIRKCRRSAVIPEDMRLVSEETGESFGTNTTYNSIGKETKEKEKEKAFVPPTLSEVEEYFKEHGFLTSAANKAFKYYNEANWHDSKGNPVQNWKQKMHGTWFKPENLAPPPPRELDPDNKWY